MNLDDLSHLKQLDPQDMLGHIDGLPDQLQSAWELGQRLELPDWGNLRQIVISGMGGSAISGDLLAGYAAPLCKVPIFVWRDYGLPAFAHGPETLVITSSHSGDTEETLSGFEAGRENECRLLAVAAGGELARRAAEQGTPLWRFEHRGQPRAAIGYSFGLLLALVARLGLIPDQSKELSEAVKAMQAQQVSLRADSTVAKNPAKRMAGQLVGREVRVLASGYLAPVARRWKTQINEIAKAFAQFELLPEADHNTLAGLLNPEELGARSMALFLRAPSDQPRNRLRLELTRQAFMLEGLNTDFIEAQGASPLAHMWTALHFGDYTAYYLAIAYGVDPTPVEALESLKATLKETKSPPSISS
jgi:glucose/mannose-6-phosphate isomerase